VVATNNGGVGIEVGPRSSVIDSQATLNGSAGIKVDENATPGPLANAGSSLLRGNLATQNGITDTAALDIEGSRSGGGNVCGDNSCSLRDARRYYLTAETHNGANALSACTAGYHMASFWELFDPSQLQYATVPQRGVATLIRADQGSGPPTGSDSFGWVRTGYFSQSGLPDAPGLTNCDAYTITTGFGTAISPKYTWNFNAEAFAAWDFNSASCGSSLPVWRIED
jgi:hypothetical protein